MKLSRTQFYAVVITPGAVLMALEIVSSRVLAPRFGSSVYVWGSIIGVFLAAMSVGYFWGGRLADLRPSQAVLGRLVLAAGVAQTVVLLAGRPIVEALGDLTHGSAAGTLLATTALFGPPTMFLAAVSPCAVKLATRDLRLLGGTAGHLYALSTGGSLIGTLGATFLLIPYLDLESILRLLLAVTAVVSIAAMVPAAAGERLTLALAFSLLLLAVIPGTLAREGGIELLADRITPYQTLRVSEVGGVRYLHSDGSVHAAVNVENGEPWLQYTRQPGTALLLDPDLESLLVIGMGSGGGGSYLQKHRPELRIDYVDIDPAIPELARELMFFEDNDRTSVYVDDGRRFLASRPGTRWDYVYVDTYIGSSIPFHLATVEFFREVADHLTPGGILGLNLMGSLANPFCQGILRSVHTIFSKLYVFRVPGGNYLFLATDRADAPDRAELLATARRLDPEYGFDPSLEEMAGLLVGVDVDLTEALLLTDRYAPVNHLVRMDGSSFRPPAVRRESTDSPASRGATEEPEPPRAEAMSQIVIDAPHEPVECVAGEARTFGEVLRLRARRTPEAPANFQKAGGAWRRTSWRELYDQARQVAAGLVDLGIEVGDRVAILGPTLAEWTTYDLGAHLAGLVTVGIYPHQSVEQVRYLLEHSESRAVFVAEESELATVLAAVEGDEHLLAIVPWSEELRQRHAGADERLLSPEHFRREPLTEDAVGERLARVVAQDTAILIYTSGTTGPPKGAMITHANILSLLNSHEDVVAFRRDDLLFSFLPMAHATERVLGFYLRVNTGVAAAYASSIGAVLSEIREVRPTIFGSVPRLFEKAYTKITGDLAHKPAAVRRLFAWAVATGRERVRRELAGEPSTLVQKLRHAVAHRLVYSKIHAAFGGRVRLCLTGAAPISRDILELFWAVGLPIYEAYGMTEATVLTHINRAGAVKLGTVGHAVPPTECRLADDGEILLAGPFVFKGYYKNEAATAETLVDGWLHTGDVGELDDEGFLTITDRKKHLIITAGGKNVAPANIERAIKSKSPLISQVHAHGDRRNYISALIAPSPLETLAWGADRGLLSGDEAAARRAELERDPTSRSEALADAMARVVKEPEFQQLFLEPVRRGNRDLARVERVRRFFVLGRDFSLEGGELTPTMKMKRKAIEEKYAEQFDRVYEDEDFAIDAGRD